MFSALQRSWIHIQHQMNPFLPYNNPIVEKQTISFWEWTRKQQKNALAVVALFTITLSSFAQLPGIHYTEQNSEVQYLDVNHMVLENASGASFTRTVKLGDSQLHHVEIYLVATGVLVLSGSYSDASLTTEEGLFTYYFANGTKESEGHYQQGMKIGDWKRWDFTGMSKPDRLYPASVSSYPQYASNN